MRWTAWLTGFLALLAVFLAQPVGPAAASEFPGVGLPGVEFPGVDCTDPPTPDMPGEGMAGYFEAKPDPVPEQADPFADDATTTIYEQYGYSGLRWHTYDLGCGPDAARNPDAVIGTAMSNWLMNLPVSLSALTSSVTQVAFEPTFLDIFDPSIEQISSALHESLFASWVPALIALIGIAVMLKARSSALATTAAAVGWALMVVLLATAIFRWPLAAGHFADEVVTETLGSVVGDVSGRGGADADVSPSVAVSSNVQESIFYQSWLAGTLGSSDSATARRYGADLFKSQALTWAEAEQVREDRSEGKRIIEAKQDDWKRIAEEIKDSDPTAYEHLTGKRSDTRVGYALLSTLGAFLALPFLLMSALLLLGSFLIVRLAVMLFPAFATLGVFPAGRGIVIGIGRTVGTALVNAIVFGIGAAVTIRVLGLLFDPESRLPGWLSLVLMPLFGFVMWVALKPFRRLTAMVTPRTDPFGEAMGSLGSAGRSASGALRRTAGAAAAAYAGNVGAAATMAAASAPQDRETTHRVEVVVPDRAEAAGPSYEPPTAASLPHREMPALTGGPAPAVATGAPRPAPPALDAEVYRPELPDRVSAPEATPLAYVDAEWVDGEEVYEVYRPRPVVDELREPAAAGRE